MCGIYGLMEFNHGDAPLAPILTRMGRVISHRGPDDEGHFVSHDIALGMRRLSIIDVAGGHQPISNERGDIWVVLNGEIYNFKSLREALRSKGHVFRTRTDTEVLVHLYEDEGPEFFKRLRGMFGVALWDARRERLVLGRDRIGEKPLYVCRQPNRLLFASEMKSILEVQDVPRRLNVAAVEEYLTLGYVPAPLTLLEGIQKVLPGHYLVIEKGEVKDRQYWDVPIGEMDTQSEAQWVETIREKLLETVNLQLVSDVPLGAFLSGGVDSSTIVALMARLTGRPVKTYSIGYEGTYRYYNELPHAKVVAQAFGTEHHEIIVRPNVSELLPKLIWHLDEPVADSACLTTYLVSKLARESVTVILSGVGGDELFGGYRRYLGDSVWRLYRLLPGFLRRQLLPAALARLPQDRHTAWKDYARYAAAFVKTAEQDAVTRYMSYVTLLSRDAQHELMTSDANAGESGYQAATQAMQRYFASRNAPDNLDRIMYVDLKTSLPDDLLALTDRMSMAASIECRAPLVDFELVELASRIPSSLKVRNMKMKYLFKKAVEPWLPREILNRKKRGFGAPMGAWLRQELQPLVRELLSREQVERRGLFRWAAVERMLRAHQEERSDHTDRLFALIALESWCRVFLDGSAGGTSDASGVLIHQVRPESVRASKNTPTTEVTR
jgi:asparagine synthase (glutamine-hydrolysing)